MSGFRFILLPLNPKVTIEHCRKYSSGLWEATKIYFGKAIWLEVIHFSKARLADFP